MVSSSLLSACERAKKRTIQITGKDGHPINASARIKDTEYISEDGDSFSLDGQIHQCKWHNNKDVQRFFSLDGDAFTLDRKKHYCKLDNDKDVQHAFSLGFNSNLKVDCK